MRPSNAPDPEDDSKPPRDAFFNPWRTPKGDNVRAIIADIANQLDHYEAYFRLRKRARRADDQRRYERVLAAIVCDLIQHRLNSEEDDALAVRLSKAHLSRAGRYRSPVLSKVLPGVLERMAAPEMAFAEVVKGAKGNPFAPGRLSTIRAGEKLLTRIERWKVELTDLAQDLDQETIILKRTRTNFWDSGDRIDYRETAETTRRRAEMHRINTWLADAPISCERVFGCERIPDPTDRILRRYFNNGSFEEGGRLFGGFWQPMRKAERRAGIRIAGEEVVTLDYGQMSAHLLYAMAGVPTPAGDLYEIPRYPLRRAGMKKLFSALQFVEGDLKRKPKGSARLLPRNETVHELTAAIRAHHHPIAHLLETLVGHKVNYRESTIMVDLLLRLLDMGIVALPIHDAVVVPASRMDQTRETMLTVFRDHTGSGGVVNVEQNDDDRLPNLGEVALA